MEKEKISFTVTAVRDIKNRKKGENSHKSILTLNSENQEKATIVTPEDGSWDHIKPGDVVNMTIGLKQRTFAEIEAEEKERAAARKKLVDDAKERSAPRVDGRKRVSVAS